MVADWVSFSDNAADGTGWIKSLRKMPEMAYREFSFDSKLVRLKGLAEVMCVDVWVFRFQTGSIKSNCKWRNPP